MREPELWLPDFLRPLYEAPFVLSDSKKEEAEDRLLWSGVKTSAFGVLWLGITGVIGGLILRDGFAL